MSDQVTSLSPSFRDELKPAAVARSLVTGVLLLVVEFVLIASFAALIYADVAPGELAQAIGLLVVGDAILVTFGALLSSYKGSVVIGQDVPAAVFAVTATAAAAAIAATGGDANSSTTFITVAVMIALTTLIAGATFILLGTFKLGNLIRFLPYPVMGGFLAGTGYLLVVGGMGIMTSASGLALFSPEALIRWLPAMALGLLLFFVSRRSGNPLWLPLLVLVAAVAFYLVALALGNTPAMLIEQGWLVGGLSDTALWRFPLSPDLLAQTDWAAIVSQLPVLLPMIFISAIAMLLNANGLELVLKRDLDLNHELVVIGMGNMASALLGGIIGFQSVSVTSLNHSMSGGRRLPGLILAVLLLLTIFVAAPLIAFIPKLVLGGLVIFVGLLLLADWVYDAWFKFPPVDYAIILMILVAIAWRGFLFGVVLGFFATLLIFVFNYSRTAVVRHSLSGSEYRSRVMRNPESRDALAELSQQVLILRLQGYIFFGTANSLFESVRTRANESTIRYVVMDFARVQGLDSTGLLSFQKMRQLAIDKGITLVITHTSPVVQRQLTRGGFVEEPGVIRYFDNLDRGVEWYEDELLASHAEEISSLNTIDSQMQYILPSEVVGRILPFLTRLETIAGDYLMRQGDAPDLMYFVESGQVTAQLDMSDRPPTRLETMQGGRVVGELGFFLDTPRTADVVVDKPGVVYSLSQADLARMRVEDPEANDAFQQIMIRLIGERLVNLTRSFQATQD